MANRVLVEEANGQRVRGRQRLDERCESGIRHQRDDGGGCTRQVEKVGELWCICR